MGQVSARVPIIGVCQRVSEWPGYWSEKKREPDSQSVCPLCRTRARAAVRPSRRLRPTSRVAWPLLALASATATAPFRLFASGVFTGATRVPRIRKVRVYVRRDTRENRPTTARPSVPCVPERIGSAGTVEKFPDNGEFRVCRGLSRSGVNLSVCIFYGEGGGREAAEKEVEEEETEEDGTGEIRLGRTASPHLPLLRLRRAGRTISLLRARPFPSCSRCPPLDEQGRRGGRETPESEREREIGRRRVREQKNKERG